MQIKIKFTLDKNFFGLDWRRICLSFIKSIIEKEDKELYEKFYGIGKTGQKPMTFWTYLPGAQFQTDKILLSQNYMELFISSSDKRLIMLLFNGAVRAKGNKIPLFNQNFMMIDNIKLQNTKVINDTEIVVKMLSPLVVRKHNENEPDQYFVYSDSEFSKILNCILEKQCQSKYGCIPTIDVIKGKMVVCKSYGASIPATLGILKLTGTKEVLNELCQNAVGNKRSSGFGKFQIIG